MRLEPYRAVGHSRRPMSATRSTNRKRQPRREISPSPGPGRPRKGRDLFSKTLSIRVTEQMYNVLEQQGRLDHRKATEKARVLLGDLLVKLRLLPEDADY